MILQRGEGREKERGRNTAWSSPAHTPTGERTCNPHMGPDLELNWLPVGLWDDVHPTKPYQPGHVYLHLKNLIETKCNSFLMVIFLMVLLFFLVTRWYFSSYTAITFKLSPTPFNSTLIKDSQWSLSWEFQPLVSTVKSLTIDKKKNHRIHKNTKVFYIFLS